MRDKATRKKGKNQRENFEVELKLYTCKWGLNEPGVLTRGKDPLPISQIMGHNDKKNDFF